MNNNIDKLKIECFDLDDQIKYLKNIHEQKYKQLIELIREEQKKSIKKENQVEVTKVVETK